MSMLRFIAFTTVLICSLTSYPQVAPSADEASSSNTEQTLKDGELSEMVTTNPVLSLYNPSVTSSNDDYSNYEYHTNMRITDGMLMKNDILASARRIKKTSIIGSSVIGGLGLATLIGFIIHAQDDNWCDESRRELYGIGSGIFGGTLLIGAVWIGCAHYKANKMMESVRYLSFMEQNLGGSLTASIDYVKMSGIYQSNGLGVSLKYTF